MVNSRFIEEYIWTLPLIAGILSLIGLITPSAFISSGGNLEQFWLWGLYSNSSTNEIEFFFLLEPFILTLPISITGFISTLIILISTILLVSTSNQLRNGIRTLGDAPNMWVIMGIMEIVAVLLYIFGVDLIWHNYFKVNSFWGVYDPNFGVIAPFISGGLSITGGIISKYIVTKIEHVPTVSEEIPMSGTPSPIVPSVKISLFNYCPECGKKVTYQNAKFCENCGYNLLN